MTDDPATDDELALAGELVTQASRLVRAIRRHEPQGADIRILSILDQVGPLGVTEMAEFDRTSQPSMSASVRRMAEQGWVSKEPNPADARSTLVALTPEGAAALARARDSNGRYVADRLAATGHGLDDLRAAVALLRDVLSPLPDPHQTPGSETP
ncbi:MarR family transcriptional regulator [Nocardioides sp. YIM 152588]|uniref:MarR family winged helix-turn-helix transcriptional regulator n=1 Tax=Nocardioides sp. YIM 152588 TaxID=3158259 RepID=UPI0032E3B64E